MNTHTHAPTLPRVHTTAGRSPASKMSAEGVSRARTRPNSSFTYAKSAEIIFALHPHVVTFFNFLCVHRRSVGASESCAQEMERPLGGGRAREGYRHPGDRLSRRSAGQATMCASCDPAARSCASEALVNDTHPVRCLIRFPLSNGRPT